VGVAVVVARDPCLEGGAGRRKKEERRKKQQEMES